MKNLSLIALLLGLGLFVNVGCEPAAEPAPATPETPAPADDAAEPAPAEGGSTEAPGT